MALVLRRKADGITYQKGRLMWHNSYCLNIVIGGYLPLRLGGFCSGRGDEINRRDDNRKGALEEEADISIDLWE